MLALRLGLDAAAKQCRLEKKGFHAFLKLAGVDPTAYADNWSWTSQSAQCHSEAFGRMQRFDACRSDTILGVAHI